MKPIWTKCSSMLKDILCMLQESWDKWKESIKKALKHRDFPIQPNDQSLGEAKKEKKLLIHVTKEIMHYMQPN